MATPGEALQVSQYSQDKLIKYVANIIDGQRMSNNVRYSMIEKDRVYQRELDWTDTHLRARASNLSGDSSKMQNVTVPVVMPQVEAAHSYLVDIFLSSYPVFPVVSTPEYEEVAQQIDAIMGESANRFQYVRHLGMALRDGLKYNFMAVEVEWKNLKVYSVENNATKDIVFGVPVETEFSGNVITRIDPYNLIVDQRVKLAEVHEKGDYVGYVELMTYIQLKNKFLELDATLTMNADLAFNSSGTAPLPSSVGDAKHAYFIPQVNPSITRDPSSVNIDWFAWADIEDNSKTKHHGMYQVTTMYVRVIPREFGINTGKQRGQNGVPQIFKLLIVNDQVVIYVERKSNAHNYLPIIVGQPIEDGLNYQTKSFADNAAPYQFLASALYNSALASQRRKVYDRIAYDPTRISKADIDRVDPVARIAVKAQAYGKPISEAFAVMPYHDDGVATILAMARDVSEMSDVSTGQNRVQRGQFQKGNKTLKEFDTTMDKSDMRPRTMAILIESGWLQPIKHILKLNILQYQPPATLYNQQQQTPVKITPVQLRQVAWQFQVADGILPVGKIMNPELYGTLLQYSMATAQQGQPMPYDLVSMGVYNLKLQGANWVDAFKVQPQQQQQPGQPGQPQQQVQQPQQPQQPPQGTPNVPS